MPKFWKRDDTHLSPVPKVPGVQFFWSCQGSVHTYKCSSLALNFKGRRPPANTDEQQPYVEDGDKCNCSDSSPLTHSKEKRLHFFAVWMPYIYMMLQKPAAWRGTEGKTLHLSLSHFTQPSNQWGRGKTNKTNPNILHERALNNNG